jgi:hypothetical protein
MSSEFSIGSQNGTSSSSAVNGFDDLNHGVNHGVNHGHDRHSAVGVKAKPDGQNASKAVRSLLTAHPDRDFEKRHIGPRESEIQQMLDVLGLSSLDQLIEQAVPAAIRLKRSLKLEAGQSEAGLLTALKQIASQNQVFRS